MRARLSDDELRQALAELPGWAGDGAALVRTYAFPTFAEGIEFVRRVARAADAMDHHPDIDIRYTRVTMRLSSHDAGGVTRADARLARAIDEAAAGGGSR